MPLTRTLLAVCLVLAVACCAVSAGEKNLLLNGGFEDGAGTAVKEWRFTDGGSARGDLVAGATAGKRCLHIAIPAKAEANSWWSQEVACSPGASYTLAVQVKARTAQADTDLHASVGVYYLDKERKWLSYQAIGAVAHVSAKWKVAIPATNEWKTVTGSFVPPPATAIVGVRLNLAGQGLAEAWFDEAVLTTPDRPVADVLAAAPAALPRYEISPDAVSAGGVTLQPDWSTRGATAWSSSVRHKLCLNGLWAVQPAVAGLAPNERDWAFIKVPGRIRGWKDLNFLYGKDRTSWAKSDINKAEAFWYVRDVEIPKEFSGRLLLETPGMENFALRIYWNGKPVGALTDQWGGSVELGTAAKAGEKGQLALYALVNPRDENAHRVAAGQARRMYDAQKSLASGCHGSLFDISLLAVPDRPLLEGARITTSTRQKTLTVALDHEPEKELRYALTVRELDGTPVFATHDPRGRSAGPRMTSLTADWIAPRLWTPDDPHLYTLTVTARDREGQIVDETLPIRFGFREVWVDGRRLMMNGQPLRLRPRMSIATYGPFLADATIRRGFSFLKDMGFNCLIRPPSMAQGLEGPQDGLELYRIADELGLLLVPYTPYNTVSGGQFLGEAQRSDKPLLEYVEKNVVRRFWNFPCVIGYSGFGPGLPVKGQPYNANPAWWGVRPLSDPGTVAALRRDGVIDDAAAVRNEKCCAFVQAIKAMDPSRPFLSHYDNGQGDGWGNFDYFNWTPWQEWEEWIMPWAANGVCPIGSWEHGLPYPHSFVNHAVPDGDNEPWITEYAAMRLGPEVYLHDTPDYLVAIQQGWEKNKPKYGTRSHATGVGLSPNTQLVWADLNARLFRSWRTFGVPMGIEPFGPADSYIQSSVMKQDNGKTMADPALNLKTPGAKADRWTFNGQWLSETYPALPEAPTGRKPSGLTPLGEALYANNRPLLVYLAGPAKRFTAKDHVFAVGETIEKQIAVVWDGFSTRRLTAVVKADLAGRSIFEKSVAFSLEGGEITLKKIAFRAPPVPQRAEGAIALEVRDEGGTAVVASDRFPFQVYAPAPRDASLEKLKIALWDPAGESLECLSRLGLKPRRIADIAEAKGAGLLVIGRRALASLRGVDLDAALPAGLPVLVLEQTAEDLERIGFRAFPTRTRDVFAPFRPHPVLAGIGAPELRDWRVEPRLLPPATTPARKGYNWRAGTYGTVASVVIETPTAGNFTPLLQCEFDLAMTPLLEAVHGGRRWLFCQLSLVEGIGKDPVATRLATNLLRYLGTPVVPGRPLAVIGDAKDLDLAKTIGADNAALTAVEALSPDAIALVGTADAAAVAPLRRWLENGGTAVALPRSKALLAALAPGVNVAETTTNLIDVASLPESPVFAGLGQNDFHYRQAIPTVLFDGKANVAEVAIDKGRLVLLGFDPRTLDLEKQPCLRLTWRRQYRAMVQILTNLGVSLDAPLRDLVRNIREPIFTVEVFEVAKTKLAERSDTISPDWNTPAFDDRAWQPFELTRLSPAPFGDVLLRIHFPVPDGCATAGQVADLGTFDDFDETWLNGVKLGGITPDTADPEQAWSMKRVYTVPDGVIKPGVANVLAVRSWNRNAITKGWKPIVRGPMRLRAANETNSLYVGTYRHADDPYLQYHW